MRINNIVSITSANESLSVEQNRRAKRYFISMMVRTLCFILTVILPSPFRWITLLLAVILPYFAVVVANAGRETIHSKDAIISKNKPLA